MRPTGADWVAVTADSTNEQLIDLFSLKFVEAPTLGGCFTDVGPKFKGQLRHCDLAPQARAKTPH